MDKIKRKETKYIIIHSSETTPSENLNSKDLNKLHRQKGFLNVKYHSLSQGMVKRSEEEI